MKEDRPLQRQKENLIRKNSANRWQYTGLYQQILSPNGGVEFAAGFSQCGLFIGVPDRHREDDFCMVSIHSVSSIPGLGLWLKITNNYKNLSALQTATKRATHTLGSGQYEPQSTCDHPLRPKNSQHLADEIGSAVSNFRRRLSTCTNSNSVPYWSSAYKKKGRDRETRSTKPLRRTHLGRFSSVKRSLIVGLICQPRVSVINRRKS